MRLPCQKKGSLSIRRTSCALPAGIQHEKPQAIRTVSQKMFNNSKQLPR